MMSPFLLICSFCLLSRPTPHTHTQTHPSCKTAFDSLRFYICCRAMPVSNVWKRPVFQSLFHLCEFICVRERARAWNMWVFAWKVQKWGPTIIACLSVCQPVCQPSNHHKLAPFTTSANIESLNSHHWVCVWVIAFILRSHSCSLS